MVVRIIGLLQLYDSCVCSYIPTLKCNL